MDSDSVFLPYYPYRGISGTMYCACFRKDKWFLGSAEVTLTELGKLCNIPEEELILLKLKYGG